jgi:hypothetical protein
MVSEVSNHQHKKPFKKHTGRKWDNQRPKKADRPPPTRFKDPRLNGDNVFCSLPEVVHGVILKHLPLRDVTSCRQLCQTHTEQVEGLEPSFAGPQIRDSIARLEAHLEGIKAVATRLPTNADSFLDSLSFWVRRSGIFENRHESTRSLEKWFGFVFGWEESATRRWSRVAVEAVQLYHAFQNNGRRQLPASDKQRFVYESGLAASDISVGMLEQIFTRLESTEMLVWHHNCRTWDVRWLEFHSYPHDREQKWKLTELEDLSRPVSHWEEHMKKPMGDSKALIEPFGLPELPCTVFCY